MAEKNLKPKEIVAELDRYIVGQLEAKKAVAIALRNRYRRSKIEKPLRDEIMPKNILMIGPTGVGKTEISRRLAKIANAPFIKVEATKFTEIGYVGRDVESIIRDLVELAVKQSKVKAKNDVAVKAKAFAEERILDALVGEQATEHTREKFREKIHSGEMDASEIEIEVQEPPANPFASFDIPGMPGAAVGMVSVGEMIGKITGGERKKLKKVTVIEAYNIIINEESEKMLDEESIVKNSLSDVENNGIVFLDELDKIISTSKSGGGRGEVSREGVQRDLLPLIEGTTVSTKYGMVNTDHILFIASGAFFSVKPSELLPELQGRLPIRVELSSLSEKDIYRILTEPEGSLIKQYIALMAVEDVTLSFTEDGLVEIANLATKVNNEIENIGARRLHTIMEKLLEDISFNASEMKSKSKIEINKKYVIDQVGNIINDKTDISKFIL